MYIERYANIIIHNQACTQVIEKVGYITVDLFVVPLPFYTS